VQARNYKRGTGLARDPINSSKGHWGWVSIPLEERFWSYVHKQPGDGCWEWIGYRYASGYGRLHCEGKGRRATHIAIYLATGEWPPADMIVCHKCDNPACVRADHLFIGTKSDNMHDMVKKQRYAKSHRPHERPNARRGESHERAKVTEAIVMAIRSDSRLQREIAAHYGLDQATVSQIKTRKTWKHVP
jgi:hypothetical protein